MVVLLRSEEEIIDGLLAYVRQSKTVVARENLRSSIGIREELQKEKGKKQLRLKHCLWW